MVPSFTNRAVLVMSATVAVVGTVDAAVSRDADLAVVFGLVVLLQLVLLLRLSVGRVSVPVRADLVRWLHDRAAQEGDSVELIADRALAAYRSELLGPLEATRHPGPSPS